MINEEPDVEALHHFRSRLDEFRNQRLNSPDFCVELVEQECTSFLRRTRHCAGTAFKLPHLLLKMVREALAHDFGRRERFDCEVAERDSSTLGSARRGKRSGAAPKILRTLFAHHFGNLLEIRKHHEERFEFGRLANDEGRKRRCLPLGFRCFSLPFLMLRRSDHGEYNANVFNICQFFLCFRGIQSNRRGLKLAVP